MFGYTDIILSVMQRVEVYNEIFNAVSKEVQENSYNQVKNKRRKELYLFCRNNVNRFLIEEATFTQNLHLYMDKESTKILLEGLEIYKEGIFCWFTALSDQCEIIDQIQYNQGLEEKESSFNLINQACKIACGGIQSAHSVHKL